jgi:hypothetical protein
MKNRLSFWIYLAGILPLAFWGLPVRELLGDGLSFAAVIVYSLVLRIVGAFAVRLLELRTQRAIAKHNLFAESQKQKKRLEQP